MWKSPIENLSSSNTNTVEEESSIPTKSYHSTESDSPEKPIKPKKKKNHQKIIHEECVICCDPLKQGTDIKELIPCGCVLHEDCYQQTIKMGIENRHLKCPYNNCNEPIDLLSHLKEGHITMDVYNDFMDVELIKFLERNLLVRKCPECCIFFEYEGLCYTLQCPNCESSFCKGCMRIGGHKKDGCITTKKLIEELGVQMRLCRMCNNYIEKSFGCPCITCRCGYLFCWECEQPKGHCECTNGHSYYSIKTVKKGYDDDSGDFEVSSESYFTCNCNNLICTCYTK